MLAFSIAWKLMGAFHDLGLLLLVWLLCGGRASCKGQGKKLSLQPVKLHPSRPCVTQADEKHVEEATE